MDAHPTLHPTDQTLSSYGLGKLDDGPAEAVNKHLEQCAVCRQRVAEMSADSFLGRLSDARGGPDAPGRIVSSLAGLSMLATGSHVPAPLAIGTLPPGLADHPDYEILRELGQGGMGVVYLAENKLMGRKEVLKVVSSHLLNRKGVLERFLGEIRNAARLHHLNIVTAYAAIRMGESLVLAMEYVEGLDLARLVKARGPLPLANASSYVHQAALGLQHAHEHGMVHRDIKPGNLMLTRQGNRAVVKVLDFGLAKVSREVPADGALTSEGQMLGTPDFIAPEQSVDARNADIRADIYSLGCTLYYLLTGRPPFQGTSLYDILQAHHSRDALPLNLARSEVPVEFAALVAKMMAKEPKRRFQEPREVAQALTPYFKKRTAASVGSTPDISQVGEPEAKEATPELPSVSVQPSMNKAPVALPKESARTARPEPMWASLIELEESKSNRRSMAPASDARQRQPPWFWPVVAAAAGFTAFLFGIIIQITFEKNRITVDVRRSEARGKTAGDAGDLPTSVPRSHDRPLVNESSVPSADAGAFGFVSLFNGRDLRGWKTLPSQQGNWQVKGGILVGSGADVSHLYSERGDYRDFHLRLEARFNMGCNAALYFCSSYGPVLPEEAPRWPKGYEVPITSRHDVLAGGILTAPGDVEWSVYGNPLMPSDEWFTLDLIADGDTFAVLLNGTYSAYYTEKKRSFSIGHFALQQSSPQSTIEFRKIEIKEFKSTDKQDPRELARLVGHSGSVDRVCFSPDGKRILSAGSYHPKGHHKGGDWYPKGDDDTVRLWDTATGQNLFTMAGNLWGITSLAFSTDGQYAASWSGWGDADNPQEVSVWDLAVGRRIHQLTHSVKADKDFGSAKAVAFSSDNRRVLAIFSTPSIHLWDLETEKELPVTRLKAQDLRIVEAVFTSDRKRLVTGSATGPVEMWDVESGKRLKALVGYTGWVIDVGRSADDRFILSHGADSTLRLWDAAVGTQLQAIQCWKGDGGRCIAMSPDGHRALTAGNSGTIRLWDLDTGLEICQLNGHTMRVKSMAFSPDGRRAASGSDDRTLRIWKLP